jgi:hypothetical protein
MTVSIKKKLSSPKKNAHSRFCRTIHKPVWVGPIPAPSQSAPEGESREVREAKLLLIARYRSLNGCNPSGTALSEMRTLADAAAADLNYVKDERILRKFLRKRITRLVNEWNLFDWKRHRQSKGGETEIASYGAALGWKVDREKAKEYNTRIGARIAEERIEDLKYHVFELLEGKDKERYDALVFTLDALEFDPVGNVAIWRDTTLRQTARDLTEMCGIQTDHKTLCRLIDKVRRLAKAQVTRPRFHKGAIKQRYEVIKTAAEKTAKSVIVDADDKPLFTLAKGSEIQFPTGEPLPEMPLPEGRVGKPIEGFRNQSTSKGRDVGENAQALEAELNGLVDSIPSGASGKRLAALFLSTWERLHHHLPENCLACRLRIERIRRLAGKNGTRILSQP